MTRQVVLATCARLPSSDGDDAGLPAALAALGVQARWGVWDDPGTGFERADLVVLRSTWDYPQRRTEFLKWCESVPALANPVEVVRWNTDKSYLAGLAAAGVPVVPTQLVGPGQRPDWPAVDFVLKPSVGCGSRGARRFGRADLDAAEEHLETLHADGQQALLQPYQKTVDRQGETALVFLGGVYSHAFVKGPMLAGSSTLDVSGLFTGERLQPVEPEPSSRRAAEDAMDAACGCSGVRRGDLLYARVDLVQGDDAPLLLELELAEPSLGFRQTDSRAELRFASAVRSALARAEP